MSVVQVFYLHFTKLKEEKKTTVRIVVDIDAYPTLLVRKIVFVLFRYSVHIYHSVPLVLDCVILFIFCIASGKSDDKKSDISSAQENLLLFILGVDLR